jgi:hypothetical protein
MWSRAGKHNLHHRFAVFIILRLSPSRESMFVLSPVPEKQQVRIHISSHHVFHIIFKGCLLGDTMM